MIPAPSVFQRKLRSTNIKTKTDVTNHENIERIVNDDRIRARYNKSIGSEILHELKANPSYPTTDPIKCDFDRLLISVLSAGTI